MIKFLARTSHLVREGSPVFQISPQRSNSNIISFVSRSLPRMLQPTSEQSSMNLSLQPVGGGTCVFAFVFLRKNVPNGSPIIRQNEFLACVLGGSLAFLHTDCTPHINAPKHCALDLPNTIVSRQTAGGIKNKRAAIIIPFHQRRQFRRS